MDKWVERLWEFWKLHPVKPYDLCHRCNLRINNIYMGKIYIPYRDYKTGKRYPFGLLEYELEKYLHQFSDFKCLSIADN